MKSQAALSICAFKIKCSFLLKKKFSTFYPPLLFSSNFKKKVLHPHFSREATTLVNDDLHIANPVVFMFLAP
jgi:hypothetical protein